MRISQSIRSVFKRPYLLFFSILLFFIPLTFCVNTNEIYEFPKVFFLYYFGIFIIFFFVSDVILNPVKIKRPHPLVVSFLLLEIISTLLSSNFYTSFFGYYSRFNGGLLSHIVLFGLYFVGINKLEKEDFEKILKILIFTILPISFLGLSQYFSGVERVYSTLGQPNWLAQYLSMILLLVLYLIFKEDLKKLKIWFVIYVLGFYCLWVTYSTSGILSFFAGSLILLTGIIKERNKEEHFTIKLALILFVTFLIAFLNLGMFKDKLNDAFLDLKKQISLTGKSYAQASNNVINTSFEDEHKISDPGFIRLNLWESTLNFIFSDPKIFFIGSGPETFPYSFQHFRSPSLNYSSEWNFVFNKPHNYYLEIWSESGIFSLFIFIAIFYLVIKKSPFFIIPSLCAFLISNFFGWPVVPTSLLSCFFVCVSLSDFDEKFSFDSKGEGKKAYYKKLKTGEAALIPLCFFYIFIFYYLSSFFSADVDFKKSQKLIKEGSYDSALYYVNKAISKNPLEPKYYHGRAKVKSAFLVLEEDKSSVKKSIYEDLRKAEKLNPENLVTIRNSIPIYYLLAVGDFYLEPGRENIDENYINIVRDFFSRTKHSYWNDAGVVLSIAKYEKELGLDDEFEESRLRIKDLRPDLLEWHDLFR